MTSRIARSLSLAGLPALSACSGASTAPGADRGPMGGGTADPGRDAGGRGDGAPGDAASGDGAGDGDDAGAPVVREDAGSDTGERCPGGPDPDPTWKEWEAAYQAARCDVAQITY